MARYIDSDYLISHCKSIISDEWNNKTAPHSWAHAYSDFIADIDDTPTADVAPVVHGRWNPIGVYQRRANGNVVDSTEEWKCSICWVHVSGYSTENAWNYCPNCGARMDLDGGGQN